MTKELEALLKKQVTQALFNSDGSFKANEFPAIAEVILGIRKVYNQYLIDPDERRNLIECKRMFELACTSGFLTPEEINKISTQVIEERKA